MIHEESNIMFVGLYTLVLKALAHYEILKYYFTDITKIKTIADLLYFTENYIGILLFMFLKE